MLVCDFGVSRDITSALDALRRTTIASFTPAYAAPELLPQAGGAWLKNPYAVDIWAIGLMLQEALLGHLPSTLSNNPVPPNWIENSLLAKTLWKLGSHMCALEPSVRPTAAEALLSPAFEEDVLSSYLPASSALARFEICCAMLQRARLERSHSQVHRIAIQQRSRISMEVCEALGQQENLDLLCARTYASIEGGGDEVLPFARLVHLIFGSAREGGLFQPPDESGGNAHLVASSATISPQTFEGLGVLLAKCLLEGITIDIELSRAVLCSLLEASEAGVAEAEPPLSQRFA